jgi:hypothetical protein
MIVGDICILYKPFDVCELYRWPTDVAYTESSTENHTQMHGKCSGLPRIIIIIIIIGSTVLGGPWPHLEFS